MIPLIIFTLFSAPVDLWITRYFFVDNHFSHNPLFTFLYKYGEWPSQITALLALLYLLFHPRNKTALYLFLNLAIGAFLINEQIFKHHWGRPRPKQVIEFGGKQPFRPCYAPNFAQPEPSRSFPCGHCTAGYYFFCLMFLYKKDRYLLLSLTFGSLLGLARIAQGGHFFSDVIYGMLVMYLTAKTLHYWIYRERPNEAAS